ncbi:MAG: diguanylate cyclase [Ectothiorhodospiraceae bacterium]|jgi:diguanylate cyclase (GGDEF)-like protein|nr:diguanylate cyclase [Ectothiorhodospiraceae bacterium]
MKLNIKMLLFSIGLMVLMTVTLTAVSLYSFRHFSLVMAQEHNRTAAEIIRLNLTQAMVNGVIDKRSNFLQQLSHIEGLDYARVVRGPDVVRQFGPGLPNEHANDEIEREVLRTGKPFYEVGEDGFEAHFRSTIPYIASNQGAVNCLQCHEAEEGAVLGVVTLTTTISHLKTNAITVVGVMVAAIALFMLVALIFLRRMISPLVLTASEVQHAVECAGKGDFSRRITRRTNDEIGQIADDINRLTSLLQQSFSGICRNVSQLLHTTSEGGRNLLTGTIHMVSGLVDVAHFKQAIEEDETRHEVYARLAEIVVERFGMQHFSIYEVDAAKNRMTAVMVDGTADGEIHWCSRQILLRSNTCRACRTGHLIDGIETPGLCTAFSPDESGWAHVCIPIMQSGTVGSVLQLVAKTEDTDALRENVTLIRAYVREAAPVLEAKRLMDTLRASSLTDAMTGLHNRRFLDEYVETLTASTHRRQSHLSILMLDMDYFKKVNDTHGHDAGDSVLKGLAKILSQSVRASDLVIRYGGEEFMLILQDTDGATAEQVAEKVRETVATTKFQIPGNVLNKTVSIGVADYPGDGDSLWQVIKYADVALYKAKDGGRNRVVRFQPEMWEDSENF